MKLQHYVFVAIILDEPITLSKALQREDGLKWRGVENVEYNSLLQKKTW
jgi:hypothetical protein